MKCHRTIDFKIIQMSQENTLWIIEMFQIVDLMVFHMNTSYVLQIEIYQESY